jgi:hypothetical protein
MHNLKNTPPQILIRTTTRIWLISNYSFLGAFGTRIILKSGVGVSMYPYLCKGHEKPCESEFNYLSRGQFTKQMSESCFFNSRRRAANKMTVIPASCPTRKVKSGITVYVTVS